MLASCKHVQDGNYCDYVVIPSHAVLMQGKSKMARINNT